MRSPVSSSPRWTSRRCLATPASPACPSSPASTRSCFRFWHSPPSAPRATLSFPRRLRHRRHSSRWTQRHGASRQRTLRGPGKLVPPITGAVTEPGLVLYRFGAALFYANASRFADEISTLGSPSPTSVRSLIVDAEAITKVDYTAARVVQELKKRSNQWRRRIRVRPCSLEHPRRLRPSPPHRSRRSFPDLQPPARRRQRLRATAAPA
jgi:MFS superfamily sulfate permease-like transporter